LQMASSAKQSKPFPKVLSSISFHIASSHSGGAVFVKVMVFVMLSAATEAAGEVRRVGDDNADMIVLPECHPNPLSLESGTAQWFQMEDEDRVSECCRRWNALWLPMFRGVFKLLFD
jgi:hypothetical protein